MEKKRTSVLENGLIWFGAGVSLAEIQTGTYFASMGFSRGLAAILIGHIIGCAILFAAGLIGGMTRKSAMETVKRSFGEKGALFFAFLNVLQLVGWTAIMIYDGALAADGVFAAGHWLWSIVIGGLIVVWLLIGVQNLGRLNVVAMTSLFSLTLVISVIIFREKGTIAAVGESMSFGAGVELAAAMPVSWLPLISDYTRDAEKPFAATFASAGVYGLVSCWMYLIGMGAAIFAGESDIAGIILKAGIGAAGLLVIVLSTVTTTFMDAYSAGVSAESVSGRVSGRWMAVAAAVLGTLGAILFPMDDITGFLYLIGSVFAPMIAIQIADFFILKRNSEGAFFDVKNLCIWVAGFILYRLLMRVDIPVGNTLPDMVITVILCVLLNLKGLISDPKAGARSGK
ncbi:MAG: putative hydroxymethylpyrimidine transporter CytX [Lachnospiraceae bacterium]|nr:putative hydroxymethylpyrimidine transporter CytX [Lachnospiraceae bacterium]